MEKGTESLIDQQTFEAILEVYTMLAAADEKRVVLDSNDITYMVATLKGILRFNSTAAHEPSERMDLIAAIKTGAKRLIP